jgi:hypothetical protein
MTWQEVSKCAESSWIGKFGQIIPKWRNISQSGHTGANHSANYWYNFSQSGHTGVNLNANCLRNFSPSGTDVMII